MAYPVHNFGTDAIANAYMRGLLMKTKAGQTAKTDEERELLERAIVEYGGQTQLTPEQRSGRQLMGSSNIGINMPGRGKTALGVAGEQRFGPTMPAMVKEGNFQRYLKVLDATDKSVAFIDKVLKNPDLSPDKKQQYINALNRYAANMGLGDKTFSVDDTDVKKTWKDKLYDEFVINKDGKGPVADFYREPSTENMNMAIRSLSALENRIGDDGKIQAEKQAIRKFYQDNQKEEKGPQSPIGKLQADIERATGKKIPTGEKVEQLQSRITRLTKETGTKERKPRTPTQIKKDIAAAQATIARLKKYGDISPALAKLFPEEAAKAQESAKKGEFDVAVQGYEDLVQTLKNELWSTIQLPANIKTTSQALKWLKKNYSMSDEEAQNWLVQRNAS